MITKYGLTWQTDDPVAIELHAIRHHGYWKDKDGDTHGKGAAYHHKAFQQLIMPEKKWHRWNELTLPYLADPYYKFVGLAGRGSSGKTHEAACVAVGLWCASPKNTTVLVSTTDLKSLELRIFGEIKKVWNRARAVSDAIPGKLLEAKQAIIDESENEDARDWRNAIIGIPCKVGGTWVGMGSWVGIKNVNVLLIADEASLMSEAYGRGISSLESNPGFRCFALANPKDRFDVFGRLCEPANEEGGWNCVENIEKTTTWKTRTPFGVCVNP